MTDRLSVATDPLQTQQPFPPSPTCWPTLDPRQAREEMDGLTRWVTWLSARYGLDHRTVPACWPEHGALVEELSALQMAWVASYAETANPAAPLDWHTNFGATRQRLGDWVARTGCRPEQHRHS